MVFRTGNGIVLALLALLVLAPSASAWAWPVDGPVLRPFVDGGDPYAGGQHRGIDIGAPTGADVRSAVNGVVSFAGQLPHQGLCLTVRTADGYSVTLVHLGSIGVTTGTQVSEDDVVGTIGPTGDVEGTEPYVYLGIRLTADPNGYLDPLTLLPPRELPEQPPVSQPPAPAPQPAPPPAQATPPRAAPKHAGSRSPKHPGNRSEQRPTSAPITSAQPARPHERGGQAFVVRPTAKPNVRRPVRSRSSERPAPEAAQASVHALGHAPASESAPGAQLLGTAARATAAPKRVVRAGGSRRVLLIAMALAGFGLLIAGLARGTRAQPLSPRPGGPRPLRKMSLSEPDPEDLLPEPTPTAHSRRRRLALRERPEASRACRRLRRPVGHHGPVSPAARRLGPHGQRNGRARNAGHGRRRSGGAISA